MTDPRMFLSPPDVSQTRHLATQPREPAPHHEHRAVGYNYRLSNLLAAVGRGQVQRLSEMVAARRETASFYRAALGDQPGITLMPIAEYGVPNWWLTCLLVDGSALTGHDRERMVSALRAG
jgi:dTDP-4-amino-4,6-dideoxygalactose transaminase